MDNLTHSLFGLTLARTPLSRAGRGATAALLLASNAPDIDVVLTAGGTANYLEFHRGPTHGPLGLVGLSFAVAGIVWLGRRRWDRASTERAATFTTLWGVALIGVVCHVLMDLPTSYGIRPLSPFSWMWFGVDWMPIIDIYLLAILGGGLWFARGSNDDPSRPARRRRNAAIALALMGMNYGVRAVSHRVAIERAPQVFGGRLPQWCAQSVRPAWGLDHWPRRPAASARDLAATRCLVEVAAMPDFMSPFSWRLLAQLSNGYEVRDVDLLSGRGLTGTEAPVTRSLSVRVPNQWTPAVLRAARAPIAQIFLGFSRFPAARSVLADDGTATVRWTDMRFIRGALDDPRQFRRGLFGATIVVAPDGHIRENRLGP
ncbi:MAG TPA: metal-dependent hydrolase [Vicinamibacterales bacterium]|nr:metal-dependent hydrolase [Vicinamibacterales bacterium]